MTEGRLWHRRNAALVNPGGSSKTAGCFTLDDVWEQGEDFVV